VRVFAFGDSVTMGWGVSDEATYCAVLERLLEEAAGGRTDFRVVSAGVNAYPNALVVERFRRVVEDGYQPDVAIIAFSFNTGFEYVPTLTGADKEKFLQRVALKGLVRRLALHNFFVEDVLRDLVYYRLRASLMYGTWENVPRKPDPSGFVAGLVEAKRFADAHGVRLVFLILATEGQKDGLHPYQQAMMDTALAHGVPAVDMVAALRARDHASLFMDHAHPSREGHALIARELLAPVRAQVDARGGTDGRHVRAATGTP
jgi:lysophospholipase L1-like esterase